MVFFFEIIGVIYLFFFGLRVCYTFGHVYEVMTEIQAEGDWNQSSLKEKLHALALCVMVSWFQLPLMGLGSLVKAE